MTESFIHFYSTFLFVPNFLLALYLLYVIVFKIKNRTLYTILLVASTFLIKLPGFYYNCYSGDETGWIACVRALTDNFNPYISVDPTTSGIGSLIPLYLFNQIIHLNYFTIRIVETIMDLVTLFFTYKVLISRLSGNKNIFYIAIMFLYGMLNLSFMREFNTYNTEHFCILIFALLIYILNKLWIQYDASQDKTSRTNISLNIAVAGLTLGFSLFVKLQNLPVMFMMFIFYVSFLLWKKKVMKTILFIAYCTIPLLLFLIFFWFKGSVHDFYIRYIVTNLEYADKGVVDANSHGRPGLSLQNIVEHSSFVFIEVFSCIFLSFCIIILCNLQKIFNAFKTLGMFSIKKIFIYAYQYKFSILFVLIFAVTFYEVVKPKNFFDHYYLLFYQPLILFFVCLMRLEVKRGVMVFIVMINLFFVCGKNYIYAENDIKDTPKYIPFKDMQYRCHFKSIFAANSEFENEIKQLDSLVAATHCDDKYIMVWGGSIRIYAYSKFLSAYRDIGNYHLLAHEGAIKKYYIDGFISDLERNVKKDKFVLIEPSQNQSSKGSRSFAEFVKENHLDNYFKSVKLEKAYSAYSFYTVELNNWN